MQGTALNNPALFNDPMGDKVEFTLPDYLPADYGSGFGYTRIAAWANTYSGGTGVGSSSQEMREDAQAVRNGSMSEQINGIVMEFIDDPVELAVAREQWERFDRNSAWLQANSTEIYAGHRGKCVCIAGEEAFVADTPKEALTLATAAHPDDDGRFLIYVPREKGPRIYAN